VIVAARLGQYTAGETGKGQFLRRNRRNLAKEKDFVSRWSSGHA